MLPFALLQPASQNRSLENFVSNKLGWVFIGLSYTFSQFNRLTKINMRDAHFRYTKNTALRQMLLTKKKNSKGELTHLQSRGFD